MPLLETRASGSAVAYGLNASQRYNVVTSGLLLNLDSGIGSSYGGENLYRVSTSPNNTTYWGNGSITVNTSTATLNPFGQSSGVWKIAETAVTEQHLLWQSAMAPTQTVGEKYQINVYLKAAERTQVAITSWGGNYLVFDLANGRIVQGANAPDVSDASITPVGNGWYYCSGTFAAASATQKEKYILLWNGGNNYAGTAGSGVYYYDAQVRRTAITTPGFLTNTTTSALSLNSTTWFDISGNNFHGTLVGSPAYTVSPGYFTFNTAKANTKYVSFADNANVDFLNKSPYTLETWAYITEAAGSGNYPGFMNHESGIPNRDGYNLYYTDGAPGVTSFSHERFVNGNADRGEYAEANTAALNKWKHILVTFDGTNIAFYIDGIRRSNNAITLGNISNSQVLLTGADRGGQRLDGRQSVIRIYNRALSGSEVVQNYNAVKGRYGL